MTLPSCYPTELFLLSPYQMLLSPLIQQHMYFYIPENNFEHTLNK